MLYSIVQLPLEFFVVCKETSTLLLDTEKLQGFFFILQEQFNENSLKLNIIQDDRLNVAD